MSHPTNGIQPLVVDGRTEEQWCQEACRIGAYDYVQVYEGVKGRFIRTFTEERTPEKIGSPDSRVERGMTMKSQKTDLRVERASE